MLCVVPTGAARLGGRGLPTEMVARASERWLGSWPGGRMAKPWRGVMVEAHLPACLLLLLLRGCRPGGGTEPHNYLGHCLRPCDQQCVAGEAQKVWPEGRLAPQCGDLCAVLLCLALPRPGLIVSLPAALVTSPASLAAGANKASMRCPRCRCMCTLPSMRLPHATGLHSQHSYGYKTGWAVKDGYAPYPPVCRSPATDRSRPESCWLSCWLVGRTATGPSLW